jgi:hypothetical protein
MPRRKSYKKKRFNRTNRKVGRAVRRVKRNAFKRYIRSATETKLVKYIDDNSTSVRILNAKANVFCPYYRMDASGDGQYITHWVNNATDPAPANLRNFIASGNGFNERVGRKVNIMGSKLELVAFLNNPSTAADRSLPLFATLRIVQGWVKGGYEHLRDLMIDGDKVAGYGQYDELPWSKYRILKDYVITRYPIAPYSHDPSGADLAATYKPIHIKARWSGQGITFQDSVVDEPKRGWSGWCPFLMICNPQADNGSQGIVNALNLRVDWAKITMPYKDA